MHKKLISKLEEKRKLERIWNRWNDNNKIGCTDLWKEDMDWIHVVQV